MASIVSVIVALQLGAFSVAVQTSLSGVTDIPFGAFTLLMQPIHLAIGVVEGLVTAAVLCFVYKSRPDILGDTTVNYTEKKDKKSKKIIIIFAVLAVVIGGGISLLASGNPDGLEWALEGASGTAEHIANGKIYTVLATIQEKTSLFMDYAFAPIKNETLSTSVAGLVGGGIFLLLSAITGVVIHKFKKSKQVK